jgi:hypothetical protein
MGVPSACRLGGPGKVTAWLLFRRRDHRHGRVPWPGPHRGPAGRAGGPPARGARAGPPADGYGSAALFLISPGQPSRVAGGGQPGRVGPALWGTVRIAAAVRRHPKVPAGWNIAARRPVTRRCYQAGLGAVSGDQAQLPLTPARRPRSGWRRRACPGRASRIFDRVERDTRSWPMRWLDRPAASSRGTSSSRSVKPRAPPSGAASRGIAALLASR